jgi:hypothetical protein
MIRPALATMLSLAALALGCSDSQTPVAPSSTNAPSAVRGGSATGVPLANVSTFQGAAALTCPPTLLDTLHNLAVNPSFEAGTGPQHFPPGPSSTPPSAATGWLMHTSNDSALITTTRVTPSTAPGPSGSVGTRMLHVVSAKNEGGVFQSFAAPAKVMFSIWVLVRRGRVFLELNGSTASPSAWTTKHGEWEEIRACSDGTVPTGFFAVVNEDITGGDFYLDRAEIREIF